MLFIDYKLRCAGEYSSIKALESLQNFLIIGIYNIMRDVLEKYKDFLKLIHL